jgi:hypothetical protein
MTAPNPPGDLPLIEGLGPEWNEFVSAIPEDKRAELGPKLKERVTSVSSQYEALKPWEDFQKSGITPDFADNAVRLWAQIENNPREVYDTLAKHLNITPAQAKEVVEEVKGEQGTANPYESKIKTMEEQMATMSQIMLAQRNMSAEEKRNSEAEAALDQEVSAIRAKYGNDVPEDQILMRMYTKGMSAEEAYQEYAGFVTEVRARRPAPMIMGSGGNIPSGRAIDPTKLNSKDTKNLVAQMLDAANAQAQ